jgi:Mn2+/Fe2+ NRAMP family transporter
MFSVIAVIVLQEMASRLGIVTQEGLAENTMIFFKDRPVAKNILRIVIAFSITLGGMSYMSGDLTGTAIGVSTITGISPNIIAAVWGCCILIIINISDDILNTLTKLLSITVTVMAVVFIATMLIVRPNAGEILKGGGIDLWSDDRHNRSSL